MDPLEGDHTKAAPEKTLGQDLMAINGKKLKETSSPKRMQGRVMTAPSSKDADEKPKQALSSHFLQSRGSLPLGEIQQIIPQKIPHS